MDLGWQVREGGKQTKECIRKKRNRQKQEIVIIMKEWGMIQLEHRQKRQQASNNNNGNTRNERRRKKRKNSPKEIRSLPFPLRVSRVLQWRTRLQEYSFVICGGSQSTGKSNGGSHTPINTNHQGWKIICVCVFAFFCFSIFCFSAFLAQLQRFPSHHINSNIIITSILLLCM